MSITNIRLAFPETAGRMKLPGLGGVPSTRGGLLIGETYHRRREQRDLDGRGHDRRRSGLRAERRLVCAHPALLVPVYAPQNPPPPPLWPPPSPPRPLRAATP